MNTWNEKGPGRKKCIGYGCALYIPVRANHCPSCNFDYVEYKRKKKEEELRLRQESRTVENAEDSTKDSSEPKEKKKRGVQHLIVPSGACPVQLTSTDLEDVHDWARAVVAYHPQYQVALSALKYYVREFFGIFTSEYRLVCEHLELLQQQ